MQKEHVGMDAQYQGFSSGASGVKPCRVDFHYSWQTLTSVWMVASFFFRSFHHPVSIFQAISGRCQSHNKIIA